ncbi:30S ribosomal protein S11 [Candidatus Nardonella dryophthoridicola]|uniref:Small ribosomal subunit protein uS11 n=1 Tax=endosymbiont of Rhynchophorus ferrugineus TaxID=1972133 RepID=A0A2Z5TH41_9GAMM|nr:30S ribosomal protein S11 [Candidatus Nardonella dryophthoridicola]QTJ62867.1 30S ribosomal protein S11 [Candidatus Nardonella dryophthoridicola]BBA85113.1 30S ribosomal protein S11 [endosymbiont of Rhynchophorus ferrugineus]
MKKSLNKKKKNIKKNIVEGIAYIQSTFNNTIISITDKFGNVLGWSSSGNSGFKGSKKSTSFAAQMASEKCCDKIKEYGIKFLHIKVSGPGPGRESSIRSLNNYGFIIKSITDITPIPHNGCRSPKRRRV